LAVWYKPPSWTLISRVACLAAVEGLGLFLRFPREKPSLMRERGKERGERERERKRDSESA
jgi:hypothetical protein